jgi:CO/xanthine dehydrogenase Mo-binding subunit
MTGLSVVGKNVPRVDALDKVTGRTKYVADFKGSILHAKILRSPHAHAKIISIDTSRAERFPGVRGVVTPEDAPAIRIGFVVCSDRQMMPVDKTVRYIGEPVAIVVADSPDIAEEALELIEVNYEILPAIFDAEEALKENCPVIVHPEKNIYIKTADSIMGVVMEPDIPNACVSFRIRKGDVEKGFQEADIIVENRYSFDGGSQVRPELYVVDAWVDGDVLTVRSSRPRMWGCHGWLCKVFSLPPSKVRLIVPYTGGCFGGRSTPLTESLALLAAMKTGRQVRLEYTREEDFFDTNPRPKIVIYIKDGLKKDGTIVARQARLIIDTGAYGAGGGPISAANSHFGVTSCYNIPNWTSDAIVVYTNNLPTGTMRGVESPQFNWALESNLDCAAHELGIDPLEIRRRNVVKVGDTNAYGQVLHDIYARECLDKTAELIEWGRKPESEGKWRKGKGIALSNYYAAPWWPASALVKVHRDGTIEVRIGTDATGQGLVTTIAQIAGEQFGVPVEKIKIVRGDTLYVPWDWGSIASRATWCTGNAVIKACQDAKQQLFQLAASKLQVSPDDLEISGDTIYCKQSPEKSTRFASLFSWDFANEIGEILGKGTYEADYTDIDPKTGYSPEAFPAYPYLAYGVEVAVNTETGEIKVLRVGCAVDIGQPINWKMCEGQIEGGIAQGIGASLYERFQLSEGNLTNASLMTYKVPSAIGIPGRDQIKSASVGQPHPDGPYGAKPLGEMPLIPFPAAVGNAVFDATGIRMLDCPMTRERVFLTLRKVESGNITG